MLVRARSVLSAAIPKLAWIHQCKHPLQFDDLAALVQTQSLSLRWQFQIVASTLIACWPSGGEKNLYTQTVLTT